MESGQAGREDGTLEDRTRRRDSEEIWKFAEDCFWAAAAAAEEVDGRAANRNGQGNGKRKEKEGKSLLAGKGSGRNWRGGTGTGIGMEWMPVYTASCAYPINTKCEAEK